MSAWLLALLLAAPSPPAVRARSHTVVGRVASLDATARRIEVASDAGPLRLDVAADARIVRAGRVAPLADARPGTKVVVTCRDRRDGSHEATQIRLLDAEPSPAPARP